MLLNTKIKLLEECDYESGEKDIKELFNTLEKLLNKCDIVGWRNIYYYANSAFLFSKFIRDNLQKLDNDVLLDYLNKLKEEVVGGGVQQQSLPQLLERLYKQVEVKMSSLELPEELKNIGNFEGSIFDFNKLIKKLTLNDTNTNIKLSISLYYDYIIH